MNVKVGDTIRRRCWFNTEYVVATIDGDEITFEGFPAAKYRLSVLDDLVVVKSARVETYVVMLSGAQPGYFIATKTPSVSYTLEAATAAAKALTQDNPSKTYVVFKAVCEVKYPQPPEPEVITL